MRVAISNNINALIKKFTLPTQPLFTKSNAIGVIKHDFQKASNSTMKFTPSYPDEFSISAPKIQVSERKVIYVRKLSDSFSGKFLQGLNSRLATGPPSPTKKTFVATPAPTPVTVSIFTPPVPVKPGKMGMPPPPPPMPPASYVPPRIIQTETVRLEKVVCETKSIKPKTTPKYNSVMDELKKRLEASNKAQEKNQ